MGVKSAKRLFIKNLGPGGAWTWTSLPKRCSRIKTIQTPRQESAQVIFGRELLDHLPALVGRYRPRPEW